MEINGKYIARVTSVTSVARATKRKHQEVRKTYDFVKNNVFEVTERFFDQ